MGASPPPPPPKKKKKIRHFARGEPSTIRLPPNIWHFVQCESFFNPAFTRYRSDVPFIVSILSPDIRHSVQGHSSVRRQMLYKSWQRVQTTVSGELAADSRRLCRGRCRHGGHGARIRSQKTRFGRGKSNRGTIIRRLLPGGQNVVPWLTGGRGEPKYPLQPEVHVIFCRLQWYISECQVHVLQYSFRSSNSSRTSASLLPNYTCTCSCCRVDITKDTLPFHV